MDPKLQQAIVAVKAGRTDIAQRLLAQLLSENPNDENAWYMLSFLTDSAQRKERYLEKALEINPQHGPAKLSLEQVQQPSADVTVIDAPALPEEPAFPASEAMESQPVPDLSEELPVNDAFVAEQQVAELPDWLQDLDNKRLAAQEPHRAIDEEWRQTAGAPQRDRSATAASSGDNNSRNPAGVTVQPTMQDEATDAWLIRGLIALIIVAAVVLAYLMFLIIF